MKAYTMIAVVVAIVVGLGVYFAVSPVTTPTSTVTTSPQISNLKLGMMVTTDETDVGWSAMAVAAANYLKERFGMKVEVSYYTAVADAPRIAEDFAARGFNIIWAHGGEYEDALLAVAAKYPNVYAVTFNANKTPPANGVGFHTKMYEGAYLAGVLAGKMTKTNAIAYVAGEWYPWEAQDFGALRAGALSVNPNVKAYARAAGTWSDAALGRELVSSLRDVHNVDIVMQEADVTGRGAISMCQEKGIYHIGTYLDQSVLAPDITLTSVLCSCSPLATMVVENIAAGTFASAMGGKILGPGLAEGATGLASFHSFDSKIPSDVKALIESVKQAIITGSIQVPSEYGTAPPPDPA